MAAIGAEAPQPYVQQTGTGNVAVVIFGENNSVTVHTAAYRLRLRKYHLKMKQPVDIRDLLIADRQAIPLIGRNEELSELCAWLRRPDFVSVLALVGPAGAGKTRAALELCRLAEHDTSGCGAWDAGFADERDLVPLEKYVQDGPIAWASDTLMIVDDAARSVDVLRRMLENLLDRPPPSDKRLRILLLERHGKPGEGWWHELVRPGNDHAADLRGLLASDEPVRLGPLGSELLCRELFDAVSSAMRQHVAPSLSAPDPASLGSFINTLSGRTSLEIAMLAIRLAETGSPRTLENSRLELACHFATRELDRVGKFAGDDSFERDRLAYFAAVCTLEAGWTKDEALLILPEGRRALGFGETADFARIVRAIARALNDGSSELVLPIRPDLVGEAAVLEAFRRLELTEQAVWATLDHAFGRHPRPVLENVVKIVEDFGSSEDEAINVRARMLMSWVTNKASRATKLSDLMTLLEALPFGGSKLGDVALDVHRRAAAAMFPPLPPPPPPGQGILDRLRAFFRNGHRSPPDKDKLARSAAQGFMLIGEWMRLEDMGRLDQALAAAKKAVACYREVGTAEDSIHLPFFARALRGYAGMLTKQHHYATALPIAEEAVALYGRIGTRLPTRELTSYAAALEILSILRGSTGGVSEAMEPLRKAVVIYRFVAEDMGEGESGGLARAMALLAGLVLDSGDQDVALTMSAEAVDIGRRLLARNRENIEAIGILAGCLQGRALILEAAGRANHAIKVGREVITLLFWSTSTGGDKIKKMFESATLEHHARHNRLTGYGDVELAIDLANQTTAEIERTSQR